RRRTPDTLSPYTTLFRSEARGTARSNSGCHSGKTRRPEPEDGAGRAPPAKNTAVRRKGAACRLDVEKSPPPGKISGYRFGAPVRSEEHTSELQSPDHLVC